MSAPTAVPLPTKVACEACHGTGCPACAGRGWTLAPLWMDCPTCLGTGCLADQSPRADLGFVTNEQTCPDCFGEDGRVLRPCVMHDVNDCPRPAVRWPEMGEPVCHEHDYCDACEEEWHGGGPTPPPPVLGERLCARHLTGSMTSERAA